MITSMHARIYVTIPALEFLYHHHCPGLTIIFARHKKLKETIAQTKLSFTNQKCQPCRYRVLVYIIVFVLTSTLFVMLE